MIVHAPCVELPLHVELVLLVVPAREHDSEKDIMS